MSAVVFLKRCVVFAGLILMSGIAQLVLWLVIGLLLLIFFGGSRT